MCKCSAKNDWWSCHFWRGSLRRMTTQRSLYLFLPSLPFLWLLPYLWTSPCWRNWSNPKFSIHVPISLFLQLDVVGFASVWECTDSSFPLAVTKRRAGEVLARNQVWVSSVSVLVPDHWLQAYDYSPIFCTHFLWRRVRYQMSRMNPKIDNSPPSIRRQCFGTSHFELYLLLPASLHDVIRNRQDLELTFDLALVLRWRHDAHSACAIQPVPLASTCHRTGTEFSWKLLPIRTSRSFLIFELSFWIPRICWILRS